MLWWSLLRSSKPRILSAGPIRPPRQRIQSLRFIHSERADTSLKYKTRPTSWFTPTIAIIGFIPIFTFALGTWQLQRLQWKVALIDELEGKLKLEPLILPDQINLLTLSEFIYRRAILRGKWDHQHSMLLGPRVREGKRGFQLITPLVRTDGSTILVNRGFILNEFADPSTRAEDNDEVDVIGILRTSHTRNNFTPENRPEDGEWYWLDVDAMSAFAGGEEAGVQPVLVEEVFEGHAGIAGSRLSKGIPLGRSAAVDLRNAHLSYVITWYSLSAFTTVMLLRLLLNRRRAISKRILS